MIKKGKKVYKALYLSLIDMIRHDGIEHAGYLSFLLMLSIFPFLVFFVAIVGSISSYFDQHIVNNFTQLLLESESANFISALQPRIIEITSTPPKSFLTLAIISAIWTASSIFEALRTILNRAYRVEDAPAYILRRLFSIVEFMIMITSLAVVTFLLIALPPLWNASADFISKYFAGLTSSNVLIPDILKEGARNLRYIILLGFSVLFIAYLYYFLPNKKQKVLHVLPGTFFVLCSWSIFSTIFKYYISSFPQINLIYGSIAGIIISLLYFYVCSLILIYGAELNYYLQKFFFNKPR